MSTNGPSSKPMTYAQAQEQIVKLRAVGQTFPKIADHLKALGYKSSKTKDYVTALAVRHMMGRYEEDQRTLNKEDVKFEKQAEKAEKTERVQRAQRATPVKEELEDRKMYVVADMSKLQRGIDAIMRLDNFPQDVKDQLILVIAKSRMDEIERDRVAEAGQSRPNSARA